MSKTKNDLLIEFYHECVKKNYVDMTDDTQALKAKVIAVDLGLKYRKIEDLFAEAEKAVKDKETAAQKQKQQQEERQNTPGSLMMTLYNYIEGVDTPDKTKIQIFKRANGSFFYTCNDNPNKNDCSPKFYYERFMLDELYKTGGQTYLRTMSFGGVTIGDIKQEPEKTKTRNTYSGRGVIHVKLGSGQDYLVIRVELPAPVMAEHMADTLFLRTKERDGMLCLYNVNFMADYQKGGYFSDVNDYRRRSATSFLEEKWVKPWAEKLGELLSEKTIEEKYEQALQLMTSTDAEDIKKAGKLLSALGDYQDAELQLRKLDSWKFDLAVKLSEKKDSASLAQAMELLKITKGNAEEVSQLTKKIQRELEDAIQLEKETAILEGEKNAKKRIRAGILTGVALVVCVVIVLVVTKVVLPRNHYNSALALMKAGEYENAIAAFTEMNGYMDSSELIRECEYCNAVQKMDGGDYTAAIRIFADLDGYKEAKSRIKQCEVLQTEKAYEEATRLMSEENYEEALTHFQNLQGYADADSLAAECQTELTYQDAQSCLLRKDYTNAYRLFKEVESYKDASEYLCRFLHAPTKIKADGINDFEYAFTYSDDGFMLSVEGSSSKQTYIWSTDDQGKLLANTRYGGEPEYIYMDDGSVELKLRSLTYIYDKYGNVIKSQSDDYTTEYVYDYDNNHNPVGYTKTITSSGSESSSVITGTLVNEYDEYGYLIKTKNDSVYKTTTLTYKWLYLSEDKSAREDILWRNIRLIATDDLWYF